MRGIRSMTSVAVAMALVVGQMAAMTTGASAQGWTGQHKPGQATPKAHPAPQVAVRPAVPHAAAPRAVIPRFAGAAPVVRHTAPPARPHFGGRGDYRRPSHGGGDRVAAGIALGVGALIVGSAIASSSGHAASRSSDYERCAARYDSFDWDTGTFENEDGDRVVCPYLD
jgi:hypothetical protein